MERQECFHAVGVARLAGIVQRSAAFCTHIAHLWIVMCMSLKCFCLVVHTCCYHYHVPCSVPSPGASCRFPRHPLWQLHAGDHTPLLLLLLLLLLPTAVSPTELPLAPTGPPRASARQQGDHTQPPTLVATPALMLTPFLAIAQKPEEKGEIVKRKCNPMKWYHVCWLPCFVGGVQSCIEMFFGTCVCLRMAASTEVSLLSAA